MYISIIFTVTSLSITSGLLLPMAKPDGSADINSILDHVTLLEQTVASFQAKTVELETELQTTKADLQDHKQRSAIEIISLQHELNAVKVELVVTLGELVTVKSDVSTLKKENFSFQSNISHDVKSNKADIGSLQNVVQSVKQALQNSTSYTEASLVNLEQLIDNSTDETKALQQEAKSELLTMSSVLKHIQWNVTAMVSGVSQAMDDVMVLESQLNTTTSDVNQIKSDVSGIQRIIADLETTTLSNMQSVKQLSNAVGFNALSTSPLQTGSATPLTFNHVQYNAGNGYTTTTGTFTAPVSGTYLFSAQLEVNEVQTTTYLSIRKAGTILSGGWGKTSSDVNDIMISTSTLTYVKQGEEVWVETMNDVHSFGSNKSTYFLGALLFAN